MTANEEIPRYVTLLGTRVAKEGFTFLFEGKTPTCSSCRLSSACLSNLEPGNAYEVVEVKQVQHAGCKLHANGAVTVYVVPIALEINVDSDKSSEGNSLSQENDLIICSSIRCENFRQCCPTYINPGDKLRIVKKNRSFKCPENKKKELANVRIYISRNSK